MTAAQQLAKQMMEQKNRPSINWDELKFKIENNKTYYFRFVPDANKDNILFYLDYKTYKLSDTVYCNYPTGKNMVQKTLNALWGTGDSVCKSIYQNMKGKQSHNTAIVLCDEKGNPISNKAKIWSITSKKLFETILTLFFAEDFMTEGTTYFSLKRTGEKLDTEYSIEQHTGSKLDYSTIELVKLDLPLAFAKSDAKALPLLMRLNSQFNLGVKYEETKTANDVGFDDDDIDEYERKLMKDIEGD